MGPVARGGSRFENLLAPQKTYWPGGPVDLKTYWPPKKLTGPYLKTKLARRKTICINLQFAHRPIIKLFRSHPRNIFRIWMVIQKKKIWPSGPVENQLLWPELARPPKKCVRASGHIANVKPCIRLPCIKLLKFIKTEIKFLFFFTLLPSNFWMAVCTQINLDKCSHTCKL